MGREQDESMEEAMVLFIKFTEESYADDAEKQASQYKNLLLDISSGSWSFSKEFNTWRENKML